MLKITLKQMFCMTSKVMTFLQDFIEQLGSKGIVMIPGVNAPQVSRQLIIMTTHLAEVEQLPNKAVTWVLQGFALCTVPKFKDPFKLMLDQATSIMEVALL